MSEAKIFSLPAFRHAVLKEGMGLAAAARFARHVATELQHDGMLENGPTAEGAAVARVSGADLHTSQMAVNAAAKNGIRPIVCVTEEDHATVAEYGAEFGVRPATPAEAAGPGASVEYSRQNRHPEVRDIGAPYGYSVGSKYNRDLDIAEIAKLVRSEIKDRVKKGAFPKGKYAVRISRYSDGRSLNITVSGIDPKFGILNPEFYAEERRNPHAYRYENPRSKLLDDLKAIATAYNYDRSESQVDYFDTNFYLHVDLDWKWESELTSAMKAAE